MATERLILEVRTKGTRTVRRELGGIRSEASKANRTLALLRSTLVVVAGARVIGRFLEMSDALTNVRNRLRLVTTSTEQLNAVQGRLFQISQLTQSSFENNAEIFNRIARSTKNLGLTFNELLDITQALNQAVRVSGATTQEAVNGLRQFSQGLAAGAFQGEELRAVVEGLPRLADAIAKEFNVTAKSTASSLGITQEELVKTQKEVGNLTGGALIAFNKANTGIITTARVIRAVQKEFNLLNEEGAKIDRTVGGAFQRFQNDLVLFVGGLTNSVRLGENLDAVLQTISKNLAAIGLALGGLIAIGAFNLLTSQLLRFGSTAGGILTFLTSGFRDLAILVGRGLAGALTLASRALGIFAAIANVGLLPLAVVIGGIVAAFFALKFAIESIGVSTQDVIDIFKRLAGAALGFVDGIIQNFKLLPAALADLAIQSVNSFIQNFERGLNILNGLFNRLLPENFRIPEASLGRIQNQFQGVADSVGKSISENVSNGFESGAQNTETFKSVESIVERIKQLFAGGLLPDDFAAGVEIQKLLNQINGVKTASDGASAATAKLAKKFDDLRASVDPFRAGANDLNEAIDILTAKFGANFRQTEIGAETLRLVTLKVLGLRDAEFELAQQLKLVTLAEKELALTAEQAALARKKFTAEANADFAQQFGSISPLIAARQQQLETEIALEENQKKLAAAGLSAAEAEKRLLRESLGLPPTLEQVNEKIKVLTTNQKKLGLSSAQLAFETRKLRLEFLNQQRDAASGAERFFVKLTQDATDAATQVEEVLGRAFDGATDAIVKFVETGKFEIGDLANEIQSGLLKFAIKGLIADLGGLIFPGSAQRGGGEGVLGSLFGGLGGSGGLTGIGNLIGLQEGGSFTVGPSVSAATLAGADNRFVPLALQDGEKVTVTPRDGGGPPPIVLNVNVNAQGSTASAEDIGRSVGQASTEALQGAMRFNTRNG